MKFGINESDFDFLEKNLIKPLKENGLLVFIFGSRAKDRFHTFSDIDVLVEGPHNEKTLRIIREIREKFEESHFPYKLDIVHEQDLAKEYWEDVQKSKVEI